VSKSNAQKRQSLLINNANSFSSTENKRDYRYERRAALQTISGHTRLKRCGRIGLGQVSIGLTGNSAHFSKLETCGNVWLCPVCSAKILTKRQLEISEAIAEWANQGNHFVFETLTVAHPGWMTLAAARKAAFTAFAKTNGGRFAELHKSHGQRGYFKVAEITCGSNGWHVHIHILRFIDKWLDSAELADWHSQVFAKWADTLESLGHARPQAKYQDVQQLNIEDDFSGYFTKSFDNPRDMAKALKSPSQRGKTPWELLDVALADPDSPELELWREFERSTFRMHQISWARGFRKSLGLGDTKPDADVASETDGEYQPILIIDSNSVSRLGAMGRLASRALRMIERGDIVGSLTILSEYRITGWLTEFGEKLLQAQLDDDPG